MRRVFLLAVFVGMAAAPSWGQPGLHIGPYLQNVTRDAVSILWETTEPVVGEVEVEAAGRAWKVSEKDAAGLHELRVTGLHPGGRYRYRIAWPGYRSDAYSFRTSPPAGVRRFRLVAYGDTRTNPQAHAAIAARIAAERPDLVVHSGDLVADGRVLEQWKPQFFDPMAAVMREVCLFPVLGNHEANSPHYYRYFALPGNEAWYTFTYAHVRFIGLDTTQSTEPGSEQYRWLDAELRRKWGGWTIVLLHHPPFSVHPTRGTNPQRWSLQPLFQKHGVQMTLAGHDHHYARCYPVGPAFAKGNAVTHFTLGGGGAPLYPVERKPWAAVVQVTYNYLVLDFEGNRVSGRAMDQDGKEIDRFTLRRDRHVPAKELYAYEGVQWERAAAQALQAVAPVSVGADASLIETTLRLPALPGGSARAELTWSDTGGRWEFEPAVSAFELTPGRELALPVRARVRAGGFYPVPAPSLRVTGGSPAWRFRNTTLALPPLRMAPRRELRLGRAARPPRIDGVLDDACWAELPVQEGLVRADGTALAGAGTRFRLAADDTHLYLGGVMAAARARATAGAGERDSAAILSRDESLLLRVAAGGQLYELAVNGRGTRYDARAGDAGWNPEWPAAAVAGDAEWVVEIAVPLALLGVAPGAEVRANVVRCDAAGREVSEWAPTFGEPREPTRYAQVSLPNP